MIDSSQLDPLHENAACESCGFAPLRPKEFAFTAEERSSVTILFGGLTWKHERLIDGVLAGAGYLCQSLPETDREAHEVGRQFCASGLCNPVYFTVGNLIRFLREKENSGLSRKEIVRKYVYFTAACGGPCRFGMYESEFRAALNAAGYDGFRVLSFSQDHGIRASTGHSGLQFPVDFGMNAFHAFILGDLLNAAEHRLIPYEVNRGSTRRAIGKMADAIASNFRSGPRFEIRNYLPDLLLPSLDSLFYRVPNTFGKVLSHLYGDHLPDLLASAAGELQKIEVDRLRVRPVVKVIGEFWAQMTESDGNYRMLQFLESEGAEVSVEPISTWLLYLLHERKARVEFRRSMASHSAPWTQPGKAFGTRISLFGKKLGFSIGAKIYANHFSRLAKSLGFRDQVPACQEVLSAAAAPYYNTLLRGGEGHLEVAKTLHYTGNRSCHLVLALKPFGCLPSIQSDGVQASLMERFPQISFLPIETSADGEVHAYSRVQMALAEAKAKASREFERVLQTARHTLPEIRSYVAAHPELRHPFYPIPRRAGITSTAANFLLYADQLMSAPHSNAAPQWSGKTQASLHFDSLHSTGE